MNLNCSFINRMTTLSEQTDARAFLQKLVKEGKQDLLCGQPAESDETAYLLSGFGRILRDTVSCMEHSRFFTVKEEHVKQALAARGFTLPGNEEDGTINNLTLRPPPESTFLQLVHELNVVFVRVDIPIQPAAARVLQTVFEVLADRGAFAATPAKGGRTIQLDSPTGVRAVMFEPNWDEEDDDEDEEDDDDDDNNDEEEDSTMEEEEDDVDLEADSDSDD